MLIQGSSWWTTPCCCHTVIPKATTEHKNNGFQYRHLDLVTVSSVFPSSDWRLSDIWQFGRSVNSYSDVSVLPVAVSYQRKVSSFWCCVKMKTEIDVGGMWESIWLLCTSDIRQVEVVVRRTVGSLLQPPIQKRFLPSLVCFFLSFLSFLEQQKWPIFIIVVLQPVTFSVLSGIVQFSLVCRRFCTWHICQFVWSHSDRKRQINVTQSLKAEN